MGFSVPPRLRLERWALTPPFHPYPALSKRANDRIHSGRDARRTRRRDARDTNWFAFRKSGAVCFLWHCPSECLSTSLPHVSNRQSERLRGIAPIGVRTFLLSRRFRVTEAILRPSKIGRNIACIYGDATNQSILNTSRTRSSPYLSLSIESAHKTFCTERCRWSKRIL
jgi:hypothetical protein